MSRNLTRTLYEAAVVGVIIGILICAFVTDHQCNARGGVTVRGFWWLECVKR